MPITKEPINDLLAEILRLMERKLVAKLLPSKDDGAVFQMEICRLDGETFGGFITLNELIDGLVEANDRHSFDERFEQVSQVSTALEEGARRLRASVPRFVDKKNHQVAAAFDHRTVTAAAVAAAPPKAVAVSSQQPVEAVRTDDDVEEDKQRHIEVMRQANDEMERTIAKRQMLFAMRGTEVQTQAIDEDTDEQESNHS